MIKFGLICLFILFASMARAETYQVITGNHASFVRVVVLSTDLPGWQLGRSGDGYSLVLSDEAADVDTTTFFDRIPRDRISDIHTDQPGTLNVSVACDCYADAFEIPQGLVIDIRDGTPPETARFEAPLDGMPMSKPTIMLDGTTALSITERAMAPRTALLWAENLETDRPDDGRPIMSMKPKQIANDAMGTAIDGAMEKSAEGTPQTDTEALKAELLEQISRAATQGLVSPDLSATQERVESVQPEVPEMENTDTAEKPMMLAEPLPGDSAQIRFETSVDRSFEAVKDAIVSPSAGISCVADDRLDIASWGKPAKPGMGLSLMSTQLVTEFDMADPESIEALAKNYLYLTFGIEARALLNAFEAKVKNTALLNSIAEIMDHGVSKNPVLGAEQMSCDGVVAFWAVLSVSEISDPALVNKAAVLATFGDLPIHLRRHLGPSLAARFLVLGDRETSDRIRELITRPGGDTGESVAMLEAELSLADGDASAGSVQLEDIVNDDGPRAPEAIARLIDTRIDAGLPIARELIDSASAMIVETRATAVGQDVYRASLRGRSHLGEFAAVLEELRAVGADDSLRPDDITALELETYALVLDRGSDAQFLRILANGPVRLHGDGAHRNLRKKMAERALSLNVPVLARQLINNGAPVPSKDERRVLAESYLVERRPDLAMGYLAGLNDAQSIVLRARALEQAEEFEKAARTYAIADNPTAQKNAIWRARNWDMVSKDGSDLRKEAAMLAMEALPTDNADSLESSQAMIENSASTRAILRSLLKETAKP